MGFDSEDEFGTVPDDETRARIAAPGIAKEMPAATMRGLPAPGGPTPSASTADLESRGLASHTAPAPIAAPPIAKPTARQARTAADQAEVDRLEKTGSGISQIHNPVGRYALRGLETIGNVLSPATMSLIPGTDLHHERLVDAARGKVGEDTLEEGREATAGKANADANKANAEAAAAAAGKTGATPEEQTMHDLMTGNNGTARINPDTGQPYSYLEAFQKVYQTKQDVKPETHPPVGKDAAAQYNASILRELGVNPKTKVDKIPPEYEVKEGDTDAQAKEKLQRAKDLVGGATGQQHIEIDNSKPQAAQMAQIERESRAEIRKARDAFTNTKRSVSQLTQSIDAASNGNGLLTSFVPTMEVLGINVAAGVHRISPTEAQAAQLPGGWVERFNAWFDKATTGKISPELKAEGKQLAGILLSTAYDAYKETYDSEAGLAESSGVKGFRNRVKILPSPGGEGGAGGEPPRPANVPDGYIYKKDGPKGEGWYKP